ncbi:GvpL/GvpF family gas vesicle protein [Nodosilinea sp. LEGE 07088]|uniref:GvpL/GvpF family gas vesicle protein n=1 Tax=Nodosilinea sp. LEGE 07088 TaxID=2777968 RepID=UPI0018821181|nr:GvpL/GvpF family gas vesicle protein [Nodosilinea sp. LEGE 07088]MBE9136325.1 GvpL/GvpF family gas vesicle protein [Nodosilinea sp. LEGE 07088]
MANPRAFDTVSPELTPEPIYLYSICPRPVHPLTLPLGLVEPTQLIAVEDIAAVVETGVNLETLQADEPRLLNAVLSHDRVICELFQHTPLLPLRFGTQIASIEHLKAHLADQRADYAAKLAALGSKVEYQIKFIAEGVELPPLRQGLTGREYFLAKKQRLHEQTAAQEQQQQQLAQFFDDIHHTYGDSLEAESPAGEAKVYLLVDRAAIADLERQIATWRSQTSHWEIVLSAPLPPYHFV